MVYRYDLLLGRSIVRMEVVVEEHRNLQVLMVCPNSGSDTILVREVDQLTEVEVAYWRMSGLGAVMVLYH